MVGCAVLLILFWTNEKCGLAVLMGLFLFLGLWRYSIGLPADAQNKIWHYNGQTVTVIGKVANEPDVRVRSKKLEVRSKKLEGVGDVSGKILVTTNLYPSYNYGDELEIICELQAPEKFNNFSYDRYLARYDIYSVCYYPEINLISRLPDNFCCHSRESGNPPAARRAAGQAGVSRKNLFIPLTHGFPVKPGMTVLKRSADWFYRNIFSLKDKLRQIINRGLSEPKASLAGAIVLGDKRSVSNNLRQKFSQSGLSHIMAISGLHISILAMLVMNLLLGLGLPRKKAFWLAVLFLFGYIVLIGIPASALRAGLMGFLALYAMNIGRLNKSTNSLVFIAAAILLFNPKLLRDDISFQLSFLAVAGIAYIYPIINNALERVKAPKLKAICGVFGITAAAQVFTLPIIACNFFIISIIAPLANLLVLWTLPLLISLILIALILSLILPQLAVLFFLPAGLLLKYIVFIVERSAELPYAYIQVDYLWPGWLIIYYGAAGWLLFYYKGTVAKPSFEDKIS